MKILLGTNNKHKVIELENIIKEFNLNIELYSLNDMKEKFDEPVEDGNSYYENALIKAKYYYEKYQIPVIADDAGLEVYALNNRPGIFSARYASDGVSHASSKDNRLKILNELKDINDRRACFRCEVVYYDGNLIYSGIGIMEGEIMNCEDGNNGFGYDSIFYLPKYNSTVARLSEEEKNKISHRHHAMKALIAILTKNINFSS